MASRFRSPLGKALGIPVGRVIRVEYDQEEQAFQVKGVGSEQAADAVLNAVCFDSAGRPRINPASGLHKTGAQFKLRA